MAFSRLFLLVLSHFADLVRLPRAAVNMRRGGSAPMGKHDGVRISMNLSSGQDSLLTRAQACG
jgi:hypothetical protein